MLTRNRIEAILFDIDQTLVDVNSAIADALRELFNAYGSELGSDVADLEARWRHLFEVHYTRFLEGEITFQCQKRYRMQDLFRRSRPLLDAAQADEICEVFEKSCRSRWRSFPEVTDVLQQLPQFRLAVLSNGDPVEQKMKLTLCDLIHFFPQVFTPPELGICKPHAAAFVRACELLGCDTRSCVYVGDRLDVDAIASTRAGLSGVWLDRSALETKDAKGVHVIHHLGQLPPLLRRISL